MYDKELLEREVALQRKYYLASIYNEHLKMFIYKIRLYLLRKKIVKNSKRRKKKWLNL